MEEPKTNIVVPPNEKGEVHLLTGQLPEPINETSTIIVGNINAIGDYLAVRHEKQVSTKDAFILVETEKGRITLYTKEYHPIKTTVEANLRENPIFRKLAINQVTGYLQSSG